MAFAQFPTLKNLGSLQQNGRGNLGTSKIDTSNPDTLKQLLQLLGDKTPEKPKVNFLEWILSVPSAIGSLPDAYLDTQKNGSNILSEYFDNLKEGVNTLITRDKGQGFKTFSDILDSKGVLQGDGAGEKLLKGILGFAGDVATDPVTYLSFGSSSLAKGGAKVIGTNLADNVAEEALKKGASSTLKNVLFGQGDETLKILGKEITSNPGLVQLVKFGTNPIGSIAGVGFRGAKAIAPEKVQGISDSFNKLFNKKGYEASKNLGKLGDSVDEYTKATRAVDRFTMAEQDELFKRLNNLPDDLKSSFAQFVEGTKLTPDEELLTSLGITGALDNVADNVISSSTTSKWNSMFEQISTSLAGEDQKKAFQALVNLLPDTDPLAKTIKRGIERTYKIVPDKESLSALVSDVKSQIAPGQELLRSMKLLPSGSDVANKVDDIQPTIQTGLFGNDSQIGNVGKATPDDVLPQMPLFEEVKRPDYFKRTVTGYKPDFIKNISRENASIILDNPKAKEEISKLGYVTTETFDSIVSSNSPLRLSIKGYNSPEKALGTSALERTFNTLEEGEKAGVVYSKDIGSLFLQSVANPQKAKIAYDFGKGLSDLTDDLGNKIFYTADEATVKLGKEIPFGFKEFEIPNVGKFVAPKEAVDVLKNYTSDFLGDEGTNNIVKIYDDFLAFFKSSVTTKSPGAIGFNIRNALGDLQNMISGGFRNRDGAFDMGWKAVNYEKVLKSKGKEEALKQFGENVASLYEKGVQLGNIGTSNIDEMARKSGIASKGMANSSLDKIDKITDKIFMVDLQRGREEVFRFANLWDAFKRTGDWTEAGKIARLSSLDYSNLTSFEKNVMRRIIPFYSFMRQNLELQMNVLNKTPGMFMAQRRFYENLRDTLESNSATEEDYANLPEWMKEGIYAITGKRGSVADVITGFGDPQSSLNNVFGSDPTQTLQNILGQSSPVLRMPVEAATGKDMFTKEDINERKPGEAYKNLPDTIKEFLDYKEVERTRKDGTKFTERTISGRAAYLMQNIPVLAPLLTQGKRVGQVFEDPKYLLNILSGGRIYQRNLDTEKLRRQREELMKLQQQLEEAGIGKNLETFYIPKEERQQLLQLLGK